MNYTAIDGKTTKKVKFAYLHSQNLDLETGEERSDRGESTLHNKVLLDRS